MVTEGRWEESFITLIGLEGLGEREVVLGQEEEIMVEEVSGEGGDLETPVQSPEPQFGGDQERELLDTLDTAIIAGEYILCDLCHISVTDLDYLKRHKR